MGRICNGRQLPKGVAGAVLGLAGCDIPCLKAVLERKLDLSRQALNIEQSRLVDSGSTTRCGRGSLMMFVLEDQWTIFWSCAEALPTNVA